MGYRVIENEKLFEVVEHRTETKEQYTIRRFNTKEDAKKFSKHLSVRFCWIAKHTHRWKQPSPARTMRRGFFES